VKFSRAQSTGQHSAMFNIYSASRKTNLFFDFEELTWNQSSAVT